MENRKKHQKQAASFSPGQKTSYGKPYNEYGIFFVLNSKKYSEQFSLKELKASSWKQQSDARSPTVYKSLHSSVYRKFTNVVQLQDSDGVQSRQLWLDLLLLSQRSGFKTQPCVMQLYLLLTCLPSLSSYTWKWGGRVNGRDPGDKNNPCPYKWSLSSSSAHGHTNRQTHPHTAWPRSVATGPESRDCALKKCTARPHWDQRERRQRSLYE